jgi:hypothetical protein
LQATNETAGEVKSALAVVVEMKEENKAVEVKEKEDEEALKVCRMK